MIVKNKTNTMQIIAGVDMIWEPGETKEITDKNYLLLIDMNADREKFDILTEKESQIDNTQGEVFIGDISDNGTDTQITEENVSETPKQASESILDKDFVCPKCGKRCRSKIGLISHLKIHDK